jgi:hypothetical protein
MSTASVAHQPGRSGQTEADHYATRKPKPFSSPQQGH